MLNKFKAFLTGALLIGTAGAAFGFGGPPSQIELKIGDVTVSPAAVNAAACIQVPIFINDPMAGGRDMRDVTFTVEIAGDTGIIDGGITANMIVARGFEATAQPGIVGGAGMDLENANPAFPTPTCGLIFNQATQSSGPEADFFAGTGTGSWILNNNQGAVGRKQGFIIDAVLNSSIGNTVANTDLLIGVLEIPIIANPGVAQLLVTATPNAMVADANVYTWDDGVRTGPNGERVFISEDFVLPGAPAQVNIFDAVDCAGASVSPTEATWADPNDGGIGGTLDWTFPGTTNVDQIVVTGSGGFMVTIPAAGATTMATIDTMNDGSPDPAFDPNAYSVVYEVEFPPMSGTFVGGAACNVNVPWEQPSCTVEFTAVPIIGMDTNIDVTLVNAQWDGSKYATLDANGTMVDLITPDSGAGTNTLVFNDVFAIMGIDAGDVGEYAVSGTGPGGSFECSTFLTLEAPDNLTDCNAITPAAIQGSVDIDLQGNLGVVDFTVVYDGTTYDNLPSGMFNLPGINGNATTVLIQANGFDAMGNPMSDDLVCPLDYVLPTCLATQDPDSTVTPVDVNTVITLTLETTGAVAATVDGVPMTVTSGTPGSADPVTWEATHVAVADTVLTGEATNPDGETVQCTWTIDINCIDPSIVSVASVGEVGITIFGTFDCEYTVRITQHNTGQSNDYTVLIDNLVDPVLNTGTGTLNVTVPPDAWIEVGQLGFPSATDMVPTVPTLGEWGMIAFVGLLLLAALVFMRRRSLTA